MLALIVALSNGEHLLPCFRGAVYIRQQSIKLGIGEGSRQPKTGQDTPVAKPGECRDLVLGQGEDQKAPCPPDR
jgi:hypothetical protein